MFETYTRNWWALALRGVVTIIFGVMALIWTELTLLTLVILFGVYVLVDGIFAVIAGFSARDRTKRWWVEVLEGLAGIIVGVLTFIWPGMTTLVLLYFIAAWAILTGVLEIVAAIQLRREIKGEFLMGLGGLASIVFGALLIIFPGEGALSLVWLIGAYAIIFGILMIALAFRLRGLAGRTDKAGKTGETGGEETGRDTRTV